MIFHDFPMILPSAFCGVAAGVAVWCRGVVSRFPGYGTTNTDAGVGIGLKGDSEIGLKKQLISR